MDKVFGMDSLILRQDNTPTTLLCRRNMLKLISLPDIKLTLELDLLLVLDHILVLSCGRIGKLSTMDRQATFLAGVESPKSC